MVITQQTYIQKQYIANPFQLLTMDDDSDDESNNDIEEEYQVSDDEEHFNEQKKTLKDKMNPDGAKKKKAQKIVKTDGANKYKSTATGFPGRVRGFAPRYKEMNTESRIGGKDGFRNWKGIRNYATRPLWRMTKKQRG